jgi:hypothetical protein
MELFGLRVVNSNIRAVAVHFYESEGWRVRRDFRVKNSGIRSFKSTSRSGNSGALDPQTAAENRVDGRESVNCTSN